jgi:hypothetical protein
LARYRAARFVVDRGGATFSKGADTYQSTAYLTRIPNVNHSRNAKALIMAVILHGQAGYAVIKKPSMIAEV